MSIVRTISHWTAGGGRASDVDLKHYHGVTEHDGRFVKGKEEVDDNIVTSDGDYAAHTLRLNTGSAGFAMAGMMGAIESPFDPGPAPINEVQFESHCKMLAEFHLARGIAVTPTTCLTHAEVEPNLGVKQRNKWDLTRLVFKPELRGAKAVGDYMRERVMSYMPETERHIVSRPVLRKGDKGAWVLDLQHLLIEAGYPVGVQDGDFGKLTLKAVLAFQADNLLTTDGIVGKVTWTKLMHPVKTESRQVDIQTMRERGSSTVKRSDDVQVLTAVAGLGTALPAVSASIAEAGSTLGVVTSLVTQHWPALIVIGALGFAWVYMQKIKQNRVDEAADGRNISR